jgi:hypothetical protein
LTAERGDTTLLVARGGPEDEAVGTDRRFALALQGTLDTFALPDVLRLLAATAKTGCVQIDGDRGRGVVWVAEGRVVAASADRAPDAPLDEVIFELLRYGTGSFRFGVDAGAAGVEGDGDDIEAVLLRAMALLDEWHALEPVVPSMSHGVALVHELPRDHVTIDADTWRVLATVANGRTVGELAHDLGVGELEVSRVVYGMVQLGVVTVDVPGGIGAGAGAGSGGAPAAVAPHAPVGGGQPVSGEMSLPGAGGPGGAWADPASVPAAPGSAAGNGERAPRRRSTRGAR